MKPFLPRIAQTSAIVARLERHFAIAGSAIKYWCRQCSTTTLAFVAAVKSDRSNWATLVPNLAASCALMFVMLLCISPAHAGNKVALVIGNSAYQHETRLSNPQNDAALIEQTLRTSQARYGACY
jgi:hypothetical protein